MHSKLIFLMFFALFFTSFVLAITPTSNAAVHNSTIKQVYVYSTKASSKDVFSEIAPVVLFAIGAIGLYLFALR